MLSSAQTSNSSVFQLKWVRIAVFGYWVKASVSHIADEPRIVRIFNLGDVGKPLLEHNLTRVERHYNMFLAGQIKVGILEDQQFSLV